jgi:hypothetical protein
MPDEDTLAKLVETVAHLDYGNIARDYSVRHALEYLPVQILTLEHGGDFSKAAAEYFRDHPGYYEEVAGVNRRPGEDREPVNAAVNYRIEMVAYREKLDLAKPADRVAAQEKVFAEDPELYKRYTAANTVQVGKVSW